MNIVVSDGWGQKNADAHFIMAPREQHIVESTVGLVNTIFGWVLLIVGIRVVRESFGIDDLVRELTTYNYGKLS